MKRIFLAIAVLCYTGAVYGQDGGRIHRSEFVPFDTREDADALNRKNTDKYLVFAPGLLNDGEEVLGIGKDIPDRFRWLTAVKSSCIQVSRPHPGFSTDLDNTLERLFKELVL